MTDSNQTPPWWEFFLGLEIRHDPEEDMCELGNAFKDGAGLMRGFEGVCVDRRRLHELIKALQGKTEDLIAIYNKLPETED